MNTTTCTALVPFQAAAAPMRTAGGATARIAAPVVLFRTPRAPLRLTRHRKRSLLAAALTVVVSLCVGAAAGAMEPMPATYAAGASAAPAVVQVGFQIRLR